MKTQKGFALGIIILGIFALLIGALLFVFWNSFNKKKSVADKADIISSQNTNSEDSSSKTFTSISGSGLTFTYPESWSFDPPTELADFRNGKQMVSYMLFSQPMHVNKGKPEVASDSMCVTLSEYKGDFPFSIKVPSEYVSLGEIMVGTNKVAIMTPGGEANSTEIKLASKDPVSTHGASYVELKNGFYLAAYAQKNCFSSDNPTKRDISSDTKQARSILESVKLSE